MSLDRGPLPGAVHELTGDAVATSVDGEAIILDAASGRYFSLDGVGARVWQMLEAQTRFEDMVRTITEEFDVDEATCARDLDALLAELRAAGLAKLQSVAP